MCERLRMIMVSWHFRKNPERWLKYFLLKEIELRGEKTKQDKTGRFLVSGYNRFDAPKLLMKNIRLLLFFEQKWNCY
jgi:hypothetical protein